jgi:predicted O-linked N-acetylglucosamine transferase (SPINDLY family)
MERAGMTGRFEERLGAATRAVEAGQAAAALPLLEQLLRERPGAPAVLVPAGLAALRLGRIEDALRWLAASVAARPELAALHHHLGDAWSAAGRMAEAEGCYRQALALAPGRPQSLDHLGIALARQERFAAAAIVFQELVALAPGRAAAWFHLGTCRVAEGEIDAAVAAYRRVLELEPDHAAALAKLAWNQRRVCDWDNRAELEPRLDRATAAALEAGRCPRETPFAHLARSADGARNLAIASAWSRAARRQLPADAPTFDHAPRRAPKERLRIGYLCGMWANHPGMYSCAHILPWHDRDRFEIVGYGYGRIDDSLCRRQAVAACDRFVDLEPFRAVEAARRIEGDGIDILVDLTGHTEHSRIELLELRPAPVQALWLGYVGTTGSTGVDWVIGDATAFPPALDPFYSERIHRLPEPFIVLGPEPAPPVTFTRAGEGLPATGTVFCSFNNPMKLSPETFALWAAILRAVPDSVLWLLAPPPAPALRRRRAAALGLDPERLVFAQPIGYHPHLLRAGLADLALDTLRYNGGATTGSLLWAGVPVLTLPGGHAAARMSASLLHAAGLDELVAADVDAYVARAIGLGRDPAGLARLKAGLLAARPTSLLFDAARFCGRLEDAYRAMWRDFAAA